MIIKFVRLLPKKKAFQFEPSFTSAHILNLSIITYFTVLGKLPRDVTERELRRLFEDFGRVRDVRILMGFAFIEYDDSRDARDAVDRLDGTRFLGDRYTQEYSFKFF